RGAEGGLLGGVLQRHADILAVAKVVAHERGEELHRDHGLRETVLLEQSQNVLHDGPVRHRQERLRLIGGHRAQPRAPAACLHDAIAPFTRAPFTRSLPCDKYNVAAHQYKAVPQMANAHPNTRTTCDAIPPCAPRNSSGKAYIRHRVAALPTNAT